MLHLITPRFSSLPLSWTTENSDKFDCGTQEVKKEPNYHWIVLEWSFVQINCWLSPCFSSCKSCLHPETWRAKLSNQFSGLELS